MGVLLFLAFLVINAYNIAAENPVSTITNFCLCFCESLDLVYTSGA